MEDYKYIEIYLDNVEALVTSEKLKDGDTDGYLDIVDNSKLTKHIKVKRRSKRLMYSEPKPQPDTFYILNLESLGIKQVITVDYLGKLVKKGRR